MRQTDWLSGSRLHTLTNIDLSSVDLGISMWHAERFAPLEIVALTQFSGNFALIDLPVRDSKFWVTVSLDHVSSHLFFFSHILTRYYLIAFTGTRPQ